MGLVALAVLLGSSVLSLVYQFFIANHGWRSAFLALGIALWIFVALPGVVFLRRQPEDLGLFPDGAKPTAPATPEAKRKSQQEEQFEHSWQLREALRTRTLWLLIAGAFLASISTGGIAFHLVAYYTDVSIEPAIAAGALSLMALSGALGNGIWGALAERVNPRTLSIFTMCLSAAAVALLTQVDIPATAYLFAVLFRGQCARFRGSDANSNGALLWPALLRRH
jgi:sugar phosphate permease